MHVHVHVMYVWFDSDLPPPQCSTALIKFRVVEVAHHRAPVMLPNLAGTRSGRARIVPPATSGPMGSLAILARRACIFRICRFLEHLRIFFNLPSSHGFCTFSENKLQVWDWPFAILTIWEQFLKFSCKFQMHVALRDPLLNPPRACLFHVPLFVLRRGQKKRESASDSSVAEI